MQFVYRLQKPAYPIETSVGAFRLGEGEGVSAKPWLRGRTVSYFDRTWQKIKQTRL